MNKKIALLVTLMVGGLTSAFAGPYDTWSNYKAITVNLAGITTTSEANFPVLVRLTNASTSTGSDVLSGSLASGLDVAFTDSTGQTALKFERERFTSTNGEFWVRVPTLLASATTKIRIYWGKSGQTNLSNSAGVWDTTSTTAATPGNAYRAVWHMNGTGSTETDATANAWVLQATGNPTPPTAQVAAPIVAGRQLNSSNNVLSPVGFSTPNGIYFLNSVQGNAAGTGWAVGNGGMILMTTNGGNTWTSQTSNTTRNLHAVYFTDANHGIAVGDSGTIDTTASGGANWGLVADPDAGTPGIGFYTVTFIDTLGPGNTSPLSLQTGYIGGDDGTLTRITNFATPALAAYTPIAPTTSLLSATLSVRGIGCDINTCLIVGDSGQSGSIYGLQSTISYKAGAALSTSFNLKGVTYMGHPGLFFAVGDSLAIAGVIYKVYVPNSSTAPTVTKFVPKTPAFPQFGTPGFPPLTAVAAGVPDSVLAGLNASSAGGLYYGAQSVAVWAVGNNGTIVRSMNTGATWGPTPSGTTNNLTCVSVPFGTTTKYASDFGWAGGASGTLLTQGNFGQWFQVTTGTSTAQAGSLNITDNELNFQNTSAFTISTWVNQVSYNNDYQSIASKGDEFYTLQNQTGGGQWTAGVYYNGSYDNWYTKGSSSAGVEAMLGGWHYIVYTRNPPTTVAGNQIWVDGALIDSAGSTPGTSNTETVNAALSVGRTLDGGGNNDSTRFFPGSLSQYTLASVGRDSSWIKAEYNTQSASQTAVGEGTTAIPISITTMPHDTTVLSGAPAAFTVVATGGGSITYQWHKNGVNLSNGGNISGATSATLSLSTVSASDTAFYNCTLFNSNGDSTVTNSGHLIIAGGLAFVGYTTPVNYVAGVAITPNSPSVTGNPSTCVANPTLPIGLSISNTTCVISGTPTKVSAAQTYTITANNIAGTPAMTTVNIQIHDTLPTVSTKLATKTVGTVGTTGLYAKVGITGGGDTLYTYTWVRKHKVSGAYVIDTLQTDANLASLVDSAFLPAGPGSPVMVAYDSSKYDVIVQNLAGSVTSDTDTLYVTPSIAYSPDTVVYGVSQAIATNLGNNTGGSILTCTSAPTLPAGLTLNGTTCNITGTPTASAATNNYVITATGPGGTATYTPNITVVSVPTSLAYQQHSMTYEEGQTILGLTPTVGGTAPTAPGTYTAYFGTIPAGLTLNSSTGAITGTVSLGDAGSSPYTDSISFTNAAGTVKYAITFNIFSQESYSGHSAAFTLDTRASAAGVTIAQTNIPILVRLTSAHLPIFQQAASNGSDVRFTDVNGNHLPYQIVHWNFGTGDTSAAIWVLANNVNANATTTINMYWGTGLSTSRSNGANVFSNGNGYLAAFHLAGPSGNDTDAVSRYLAETPTVGSAVAPTAATGAPLPGGRTFTGGTVSGSGSSSYYTSGDYMYVDDSAGWANNVNNSAAEFEFGFVGSYSISGWINYTSESNCCGNNGGIISHGNDDWQLQIADSEFDAAEYDGSFINAQSTVKTPNAWHYVVGERVTTGTASVESLYVDGNPIAATSSVTESGSKSSSTYPLLLGTYPAAAYNPGTAPGTAPNHYFNGSLVEATISNTNRSPSWVKLAYKNQKASVTPIYNLAFPTPSPSYVKGTPITTDSPTVIGKATRFGISGTGGVTNAATFNTATGLTFDTTTGKITGTPTTTLSSAAYTVTGYSDSAWSTTAPLTITVQGGPTISTNPAASQSVVVGTAAKLGVTVTGTAPFIYAWTHTFGGITDTVRDTTSSALTDTLRISSIPASDTGSFNVIVNNGIGSPVTSTAATFTITPATFIYPSPTAIYGKRIPITTDSPSVTGAVTKFTVSPTLPAGLVLDSVTGKITGTPTTATATAKYAVTGVNGPLSSTDSLTFTVNGFSYVTNHPALFGKNVTITHDTLTSVVGTFTHFTVNPALPGGLSLDSNVGVIKGTPTVAAAEAKYAITGTYSGGTAVDTFDLTVLGFTYKTQPATFATNSLIAPDSAQVAVGPLTHYSVSPALPTGLALDTNVGLITGTPTVNQAAANYLVTASDSGKASTLDTLNIAVNSAPVIATNPSGQSANVGATVKFGVTLTAGATTPLVYAWLHMHGVTTDTIHKDTLSVLTDTLTLASVPLADTGSYKVIVSNVGGTVTSTSATLTLISAPVFTYSTPVVYGKRITITPNVPNVTGSATKFTVSPALPGGLVLDTVAGTISGTPTTATAAANYVVTGFNGTASSTDTVNITVNGFSYVANHPALFGKNVTLAHDSLTSVVGSFTGFSVSPALPAGIAFNTSTGVLSGTPTVATAAAKYAVTGSYTGGTAVDTLNLTVLGFTYATQPVVFINGNAVTPDSAHVTVGPLTHFAVSPALSAGLALDTNVGVITGTPTVAQAATNYVVTASDSGKASTVDTVNITVNTLPVISSSPAAQTANLGSSVKFGVTLSAGTTPIVYKWLHTHGATTDTLDTISLSALTDTLTLASIPLSDTGSYKVLVSNASSGGVVSSSATLLVVTTPVATPSSESFLGSVPVTLATTSGAAIHYTLDGSTPTSGSTLYTGAITVTTTTTINAIAVLNSVQSPVMTDVYTLTTVATPVASQPSQAFVGSIQVTLSTTSGGATIHYTTNGATPDSTSPVYSTALTFTTTTTLKAVAVLSGAVSGVSSNTYTLNTPAVISTAPHDTTVLLGAGAKFTVVATGPGTLYYQWQKNGGNLSNGGTLSGVTTATLTNSAVASTDTGTYRVIITDSLQGTATLDTSTGGRIIINAAPTITTQPSAITKAVGGIGSFTVVATGSGTVTYQWIKNGQVVSNSAGHISGATSATLVDSSVAAGDTGTYRVVLTNTLNSTAATDTSAGAYLTVGSAPSITTQPSAITKTVGSIGSFTVVATAGGTLSYQWLKNGQVVSNSAGHISGATSATLVDSSVATTDTGTYRVVLTSTLNSVSSSDTSTGAYLTVNVAPTITTQPSAVTKATGTIGSFTVVATGSGTLSYQWLKNGAVVSNSAGHISGATSATLVDSSVAAGDTGTYRVVLTNTLNSTTATDTSTGAYLTVSSAPSITTQPAAITKTVGSIGSFTVVATGSGTVTYQWIKNGQVVSNSAGHISGATSATLVDSSVAVGDTGTYRVVLTNTLNSVSATDTSAGAYLTVNAAAGITTQPTAITRATGAIGSFTVVATGSGTLSYQWLKNGAVVSNSAGHISGATAATLTDSSVATGDTGTYRVVITNTLNSTSTTDTSTGAYLTVNVAPSITTQPVAITRATGAIGSFTVVATGSGTLSYQWLKNGAVVSNSAGHISGATTATLTDSSVAAGDTGTYRVLLTNTLNSTTASDTSTGAYLTVNAAANITTQPVAVTKTVGAIGSFTVVATGSGTLTYQWLKNGAVVSNTAGHISGATAATLTDSAVAVADTGTYRVVVTNTLNSTSTTDTSTGAHLTVNVAPSITTQPAALTKATGTIGSFTVVATGSGTLSYQWLKNGAVVSNSPGHISGATTATLTDSSVAAGDTGTYRVLLTNTLNSTTASDTSTGAYLTVNAAAGITTQPVAITKTVGAIGSFTVVATGSGTLSYQWLKNGAVVSNSAGHISGATAATLTDSSVATGDTGTYRVVVTNTLNSTSISDTSTGAYLTVNAAPVITTQPAAITKATGTIGSFTVVATGSGTLSYQWLKNGAVVSNSAGHISGATSATLVDSAVAVADTGTYRVVLTSTLNSTSISDTSTGAYLTVNAAPVITTQPAAITKTVGAIGSFTVVATGSGTLSYQWLKNGAVVANSAGHISGATSATLVDSSIAAGDTGTYRVVLTNTLNATTASDTSSGAYLTINTAAVITSQPVSTKIAAGSNATFSVITSGGVGPLTYQWFMGSTALKDTTLISGSKTSSLTLSSVQGPASDSGRLADSLTVVVTNAGGVGTVTSNIAILTVNALPNIVTQPVNSPITGLGQTATFSVVANKGVSPLVYQWFKSGTPLTDSTGKVSGSKTATLTISHVAATDTGAGLYYVVVANTDSVGLVTSNAVNLEPPLALLTEAAKLAAIRMSGSSIVFALPSGVASAQISLMDVWGRSVWSQSLGHGISQLTWNGNASGGGRSGAGFFIVRMVLFDAAEHQTGLIERKVAYTP